MSKASVSSRSMIQSVAAVSTVALSALAIFKLSRVGYETAPYTTVTTDGAFEIRDYPDVPVVTTPMSGATLQGNGSFRRLFQFISGENEASQKISMTTPVFTTPSEVGGQMSFVVPEQVARMGTPQANNPDVEVGTMAGGRFAVYRFSGSWDSARFREAERKLAAWMEKSGLAPTGPSMLAGYDPPFTPAFLRRNEVLVRVAGSNGLEK